MALGLNLLSVTSRAGTRKQPYGRLAKCPQFDAFTFQVEAAPVSARYVDGPEGADGSWTSGSAGLGLITLKSQCPTSLQPSF